MRYSRNWNVFALHTYVQTQLIKCTIHILIYLWIFITFCHRISATLYLNADPIPDKYMKNPHVLVKSAKDKWKRLDMWRSKRMAWSIYHFSSQLSVATKNKRIRKRFRHFFFLFFWLRCTTAHNSRRRRTHNLHSCVLVLFLFVSVVVTVSRCRWVSYWKQMFVRGLSSVVHFEWMHIIITRILFNLFNY